MSRNYPFVLFAVVVDEDDDEDDDDNRSLKFTIDRFFRASTVVKPRFVSSSTIVSISLYLQYHTFVTDSTEGEKRIQEK